VSISTLSYTLRPFTLADQTTARRLILEGLGTHFGFIDETMNPDVDNIEANYSLAGHPFIVAELDNELIATGALHIHPDPTGHHAGEIVGQFVRVSVRQDFRRRGVASAIVRQLIDVARSINLHTLIVETTKGWTDAIGLYQSLGFTQYYENDHEVYMELPLTIS
jgi:GNAT superfamily N-acetyltransferase